MNKSVLIILVIASLSFVSEEDFLSSIKQKADNYFALTKRAKLALYFNQPSYSPGDTVFFKTSYLSAKDLKPIQENQIVHVCLFDQSGKKKLTRGFSVSKGLSSNSWVIPENMTPGNYILIAFTDWMKNLDQSLFFRHEFTISGKNVIIKRPLKDTVEFYPEGGQLIAGIENNIAVHYTGSKKSILVTIKESGKEITTLSLNRDSTTTFRFTPTADADYYAELFDRKIHMPRVNATGVSLLADISDQRITLQLERQGDIGNLYLLVFNGGGLIFQNMVEFGGEKKKILALPQSLPNGIAQVVIVDSKYNLIARRVVYIDTNPHPVISISKIDSNYSTRQLVGLNLQIKNLDGYLSNGILSCRVISRDLFQLKNHEMDFLTFKSDISNTFLLYKEAANSITINNYLITQTCPWFEWNNIIGKNQIIRFKSQEHLTLSGKAVYAKNGLPVRDSTLIMFYLEKNLSGYETYAIGSGNFSFPLVININSSDRFFYTATYKGNDIDEIGIKINDPDSIVSIKSQSEDFGIDLSDSYFNYSQRRNLINRSYSFFINQNTLSDSTFDANAAMENELSGADATVTLSNYLQMPTMEEVLKEIMRAVDYRKINGRHVVRVYTTGKRPNNHTGPLYVIDGQITKNPEHFLRLNPSDVISIKLVKDSRKLFALGQLGANGVILLKTKSHPKIQEHCMLDYSGLLPVFRVKPKQNINLQIPDLRSCLNWNPTIQTGYDGYEIKFTTSDDVGDFILQISGLTENGSAIYYEAPFKVKYQGN